MRITGVSMIAVTVAGMLLTIGGCASDRETAEGPRTVTLTDALNERVSFRYDGGTLGDVVRAAGEQCGGGMVLMYGGEAIPVGPIHQQRSRYDALIHQICEKANVQSSVTPYYYFIRPAGYESLESLAIAPQLDPGLAEIKASVSFGAGTKLYNVFAVLSHIVRRTVIADNVVSEAAVGELFLTKAPLPVILEAVLQSARLRPDAIAAESGDGYVLLHARENVSAAAHSDHREGLSEEAQRLLGRKVTVYLPELPPEGAQMFVYHAGKSLGGTLAALSRQVGVNVYAEGNVADLPVTPGVYIDLPVRTVMDLLIRQWPVPGFDWELREDGLHIIRR